MFTEHLPEIQPPIPPQSLEGMLCVPDILTSLQPTPTFSLTSNVLFHFVSFVYHLLNIQSIIFASVRHFILSFPGCSAASSKPNLQCKCPCTGSSSTCLIPKLHSSVPAPLPVHCRFPSVSKHFPAISAESENAPRGLLLLHVGTRFWGIITKSLNTDVWQPNCFTFRLLARRAEPRSCSLVL